MYQSLGIEVQSIFFASAPWPTFSVVIEVWFAVRLEGISYVVCYLFFFLRSSAKFRRQSTVDMMGLGMGWVFGVGCVNNCYINLAPKQ